MENKQTLIYTSRYQTNVDSLSYSTEYKKLQRSIQEDKDEQIRLKKFRDSLKDEILSKSRLQYIESKVYANLMCKSLGSSSDLLEKIIDTLEKHGSNKIGLNIKAVNNLTSEPDQLMKILYEDKYDEYVMADKFFIDKKNRYREQYIQKQLQNILKTVYGTDEYQLNDSKEAININIEYTISNGSIGTGESAPRKAVVLPNIIWKVRFTNKSGELLKSYEVQTKGLCGDRTVYSSNDDQLFERIAQIHIGYFAYELLLKFGLNIEDKSFDKYYDLTFDDEIEKKFEELKNEHNFSDDEIYERKLKFFKETVTSKEKFKQITSKLGQDTNLDLSTNYQKDVRDKIGSDVKSKITNIIESELENIYDVKCQDILKDILYEKTEEWITQNIENLFDLDSNTVQNLFTVVGIAVALRHSEYMDAAYGAVDIATNSTDVEIGADLGADIDIDTFFDW